MYHSILTYALRQTLTSLITLGRNVMYHTILNYALKQTYLYQ